MLQHKNGPITVAEFGTKDGSADVTVGSIPRKSDGDPFFKAGLGLIDGECWLYHYALKFRSKQSPHLLTMEEQGRKHKALSDPEEKTAFQFKQEELLAAMRKESNPELVKKVDEYERYRSKWWNEGRMAISGRFKREWTSD